MLALIDATTSISHPKSLTSWPSDSVTLPSVWQVIGIKNGIAISTCSLFSNHFKDNSIFLCLFLLAISLHFFQSFSSHFKWQIALMLMCISILNICTSFFIMQQGIHKTELALNIISMFTHFDLVKAFKPILWNEKTGVIQMYFPV